ncbi:MAG: HupU protein [Rhodospirillales bacterium]|nr:HupU protein [Rhodospirillales bacterium]
MRGTDFTLLWIQAGSCGGCAASAGLIEDVGLTDWLRRFGISLLWHPSLSRENGAEALRIFDTVLDGSVRLDCLVVEGAMLRGPGGSGKAQMLAGSSRPVAAMIADLAAVSRYTVAVGSCAAFGGFPTADVNPTDGTGLQWLATDPGGLLGEGYLSAAGLPVINVAGCAPHPGWIAETLAALAIGGLSADELDEFRRPRFFADHLAHHGCSRNEFYEFKAAAETPSERGCLMENLGCKATQAPGDCNVRRWNGLGSCTDGGFACVACTSPGFEHKEVPFLETAKVAGIPDGLPDDMPKAWYVALAALSRSAMPTRVRRNARADNVLVPPSGHGPKS